MNRAELASLLMRDVQGLDLPSNERNSNMNGYGYDGESDGLGEDFGADDPIKRAGFSTLPIQITVANAASLNLNLFSNVDVDAAALPTGLASPTLANYKSLVKYLLANPSQMQSVIVMSNEAVSTGAPLLASLKVTPTRNTPFGLTCGNETRVQSYQTTQDFQANRVTVPMQATLDGFTYLACTSDANASGGTITFNLTFLIGRRVENRKNIRGGAPMTMAPGGRGPRVAVPQVRRPVGR